ncbi:TRAP transporter small permease [Alteribacillus persepolensis]|uniref:TRAP transporter small permease n=1 Tax=Alteribacillus persepolensis TaxID=568899 RepID=UPI000B851884|nr:TRAP transporter small permease [Alteribacillus persepolensis]
MEEKYNVSLESQTPLISEKKQEVNRERNIFFKLVDKFNQLLASIAGTALILMMLLVVFNSVKRLFSDPVAGTVEMVSWLAAITAIFSLGFVQLHKGHVFIDLLFSKFPQLLQRITHTAVNVVSIIFFIIAGWQLTIYGLELMENGIVSETMRIPFYPIVVCCSIGFLGLLLAVVKEIWMIWKGEI